VKYLLLEWMPHKAQFSVIDQGVVFGEGLESIPGLAKPIPGS
jgi:hypothetical protein